MDNHSDNGQEPADASNEVHDQSHASGASNGESNQGNTTSPGSCAHPEGSTKERPTLPQVPRNADKTLETFDEAFELSELPPRNGGGTSAGSQSKSTKEEGQSKPVQPENETSKNRDDQDANEDVEEDGGPLTRTSSRKPGDPELVTNFTTESGLPSEVPSPTSPASTESDPASPSSASPTSPPKAAGSNSSPGRHGRSRSGSRPRSHCSFNDRQRRVSTVPKLAEPESEDAKNLPMPAPPGGALKQPSGPPKAAPGSERPLRYRTSGPIPLPGGEASGLAGQQPSPHPFGPPPGARHEPFDAARTGRIPAKMEVPPPADLAHISINFVSSTIGMGIFAARDIAEGEWFMHERPAMAASYDITGSSPSSVQDCWASFQTALNYYGAHLLRAYPRVASETGHTKADLQADPWDPQAMVAALSQNLVPWQGRVAAFNVTAEQYESYLQTMVRFRPAGTILPHERRNAVRTFFSLYAYEPNSWPNALQPATREGRVFLLGSLINHRCTPRLAGGARDADPAVGPNAMFSIGKDGGLTRFIEPGNMAVRARRPIKAGEEITVDYGKRNMGFVCECETCRQKTWAARWDRGCRAM